MSRALSLVASVPVPAFVLDTLRRADVRAADVRAADVRALRREVALVASVPVPAFVLDTLQRAADVRALRRALAYSPAVACASLACVVLPLAVLATLGTGWLACCVLAPLALACVPERAPRWSR